MQLRKVFPKNYWKDKTKEMEAQVGRAKFLENRGLGFIDPGAKSTEIILREYFESLL